MTGAISYDHGNLGDLSGNIHQQFNALEQLAGQLKRQVHQLQGNWASPDAAAHYQDAQARWDTLFGQAREQLNGLGRGVQNASERMGETDRSIGNTFKGTF
ncbi:WXG100 family type VII secretion target [Gordonia sp. DT218]|uniref:WXG100 family type VII secretion target n=1 Tax=unclassified Gordonia (in: high G+C Gram-positive bacteria) TaxID=2657482 RepID=UPI003CEB60E0